MSKDFCKVNDGILDDDRTPLSRAPAARRDVARSPPFNSPSSRRFGGMLCLSVVARTARVLESALVG